MAMLETTLSSSFLPGVNLKGEVAGANWLFLRPSILSEHVVVLGVPPPSSLATLTRFSRTVTIVGASGESTERGRPRNVRWCDGVSPLPLADGSVDVLLVPGYAALWRLLRDAGLRRDLRRVLRADGCIYTQYHGVLESLFGQRVMDTLAPALPHRFVVTPIGGEVHTAVPEGDTAMMGYFRRMALESELKTTARIRKALRPWLRRIGGRGVGTDVREGEGAAGWSPFDRLWRRRAVLTGGRGPETTPPEYLRAIAASSGLQLDGFRWALSAKGDYSSRKLLFFLCDPGLPAGAPPTYIAKMVRDPAYNRRLENECRALRLLRESGLDDPASAPKVVFFGYHAGLAVVGESVIDGVPFVERSRLDADCPYLGAAVDWFTTLGIRTVSADPADPVETSATLSSLLETFQSLYGVPQDEERFLRAQIERLGTGQQPMPLVMQHGDPGIWNLLARPSGRIAVLDWEAAETHGLPLWDLYYFLRTYGVAGARLRGVRDSLEAFTRQIFEPTPFRRVFTEAVGRYNARVGVDAACAEPLFYTCWMHRALKEATRLPAARLQSGRYLGLLRALIARSPEVRRVLGG
jgi:hypothetical protein